MAERGYEGLCVPVAEGRRDDKLRALRGGHPVVLAMFTFTPYQFR